MSKPLVIGVDIRDLRLAKTGTKTYLEEVCREFRQMDDDSLRFHFFDSILPVYSGENKLLKWAEHFRLQFWKQVVLPLKAFFKGCKIVFCTDVCVPYVHLGYKTIPVFHDAFCFESPENYGKLWLWIYMKTAVPAAERSPFVVIPTEWSKKQIIKYTHIREEQVAMIYEGPKSLNTNTANINSDLLTQFGLTSKGYILHVGSMYKRKNIPALIEAFDQLVKSKYADLQLVLAGPTPANENDSDFKLITDTIAKKGLETKVKITGYLKDEELAQLYQNALLYVFPSLNEGFGIPVLEAFKHDVPVLVADNTCLPEVGGDAVVTFNPFDMNDIASKIKIVLDVKEMQEEMIVKGRERLKYFSWQQTAAQLVEVFRKAVA